MKFVSIDLETCGLKPDVHPILEMGAVLDTLGESPNPLGRFTFRALVIPADLDAIPMSPYTALLHRRLLEEIEAWKKAGGQYQNYERGDLNPRLVLKEEDLAQDFTHWIDCMVGHKPSNVRQKITVAGKNVASFDIPFLKRRVPQWSYVTTHHRTLDVTPMFFRPGDECLPNLDTCLERAGIAKRTAHGALDDALLVCDLVAKAFENKL